MHTKEVDAKTSRISQLEATVHTLRTEKDDLFDQLQLRQAELESSRHLLETLQGQCNEYQYQIRESAERMSLLHEELADAQRAQAFSLSVQSPSTPADEVSRLLQGAETKYEGRVAELRRQLMSVERERDEGEIEWSRKLSEKQKEIETLNRTIAQSMRSDDVEKERIGSLQEEIDHLHEELRLSQVVISDLRSQAGKVIDVEASSFSVTSLFSFIRSNEMSSVHSPFSTG